MDTPPYSDISAQLSPGAHAVHVNGEAAPNAVGQTHPAGQGPANGSDAGAVDIRALYSTSWTAIESPPPPTLREILTAYKQKGDGDRDMLLAMLNAKSAEDQRIASQLSLRRTMLEINKYTIESRSLPQSHLPYPQASHSQNHGQHMYTYVPDEPYALAGTNHHHHQQHRIAPASPSALPHTYSPNYSSSHRDASRMHAHLRAVESPPLSSVTQKSILSNTRIRPASLHSHSRSSTRSQIHAIPPSQSQVQTLAQGQSQRRKRPRHSRSRSRSPPPVSSTSSSHRAYAYTYTRSPPTYERTTTHSHTHSEVDPEVDRSPYSSASASDSGSPHGHTIAHVQGQGQSHNYPRTMAIGSLLSAGARAGVNAATSSSSKLKGLSPNGASSSAAAAGQERKERSEQEREMEQEDELEEDPPRKTERGIERRGSRDER